MQNAPAKNDTLVTWILGAMGVFMSIELVLWITGQVAGRLFSGVWPPGSFTDSGIVSFGLAQNLGDPRRAWPARMQPYLPGPVGFYLTMMLVFGAAAALVVGAYSVWQGWRPRGLRWLPLIKRQDRGASWAKRWDLTRLAIKRWTQGRLTLGRTIPGGLLLAAEARQSVIVIGPSQSGKTTGFAVPAILEWEGPLVATSVKSDLLHDTLKRRQQLGHVWVFDPTGSTGAKRSNWSPLSGANTWFGAQRAAHWLCSAGKGGGSAGVSDADFWYSMAAKLMAPLLFAAATTGRGMADVLRWLDTQERKEVEAALELAQCPEALAAMSAHWNREERVASSVITTAETTLVAYADPVVLQTAGPTSPDDIDINKLLDGNNTLYLCAPAHEQERLRPLFECMVKTIVTTGYERAAATGKPIDPCLLMVLDEAANISPMKDLDTLASTAAGQGIQIVTVWQDLAQIKARYGERSSTVANNHRAKVILSGISDPGTLEWASRLIGEGEMYSRSYSHDKSGGWSQSRQSQYRALASGDTLRQMKIGEGMLIYGNLPPTKLALRAWYSNRELKALAEARGGGDEMAA